MMIDGAIALIAALLNSSFSPVVMPMNHKIDHWSSETTATPAPTRRKNKVKMSMIRCLVMQSSVSIKPKMMREEIVSEVALSQRMISHYECEIKNPNTDMVAILAQALAVTPDELLGIRAMRKIADDPAIDPALRR